MQCCSRTPPFLVPRLRLSVTKSSTAAHAAGSATDAALFVGGIVAILGLYVVYWLGMTLLAMLPILGGLGVFTWVFGYRALFHLANHKVKGD